jgi:uncharacterized protein YecE (DUF72 family)
MESWINTWLSAAPPNFTFSIKVSRYITDYARLKGQTAVQLWNKFSKTLDKISDKIEFWLFKMPLPTTSDLFCPMLKRRIKMV